MKKLYLLCTADEYELPVCYAPTLGKLSVMTHINRNTLAQSLYRGNKIEKKYKVEKIIF